MLFFNTITLRDSRLLKTHTPDSREEYR